MSEVKRPVYFTQKERDNIAQKAERYGMKPRGYLLSLMETDLYDRNKYSRYDIEKALEIYDIITKDRGYVEDFQMLKNMLYAFRGYPLLEELRTSLHGVAPKTPYKEGDEIDNTIPFLQFHDELIEEVKGITEDAY